MTFEQFLEAEKAEMFSSGDEATLNMSAVKDVSDYVIINDKPDVESLTEYVAQQLGLE